jgi:ankyrin repeat protein
MAAQGGLPKVVEHLISRGAHVNSSRTHKEGETALHLAAGGGHSETVSVLINSGVADVNLKTPKQKGGITPLHKAAQNSSADVVAILCACGADVDDVDSVDRTALHIAADAGDLAVVQILLDAGASLNMKDSHGKVPLQSATYNKHVDVARLLVVSGADLNIMDDAGQAPLHVAAIMKSIEIAEILLTAGAEVDIRQEPRKSTPLLLASSVGEPGIVDILLQARASVHAQDVDGCTALHRAQTIRREYTGGGESVCERERERVCVCVCVCEREMLQQFVVEKDTATVTVLTFHHLVSQL